METNKPLVAIHCLVYNHEPYLRRCIDGFVRQRTNFPFVAIVHEDASTDKSADIIREYERKYPNIIKPIYETENQYSKPDGRLIFIMQDAILASGAKYVAICEGDDFWTDPLKLQKQVDILENNPQLMAVVTDTSVVDSADNIIVHKQGCTVPDNREGVYNLRDFFSIPQHRYSTATVMYRTRHYEEVNQKLLYTISPYFGDWQLWIILHSYGSFYYIDEVTAAYRINPTSITHVANRIERARASFDVCRKIADILPEQYSDIAEALRNTDCHIMPLAHAYRKEHKYFHALWYTMVSLVKSPSLTYAWFKNYFNRFSKK
ncbi:MAG: glycosyltransferase [Bacteroidales bacterium]|nr:glycosyltransferase [Bacteroidales bacterium]